jgi:hypothetical protein
MYTCSHTDTHTQTRQADRHTDTHTHAYDHAPQDYEVNEYVPSIQSCWHLEDKMAPISITFSCEKIITK